MGASGYRSNTDGCNDVVAPSNSVLKNAGLVLFRPHLGGHMSPCSGVKPVCAGMLAKCQ